MANAAITVKAITSGPNSIIVHLASGKIGLSRDMMHV